MTLKGKGDAEGAVDVFFFKCCLQLTLELINEVITCKKAQLMTQAYTDMTLMDFFFFSVTVN